MRRAFTLIELLIVIVVLSILAGLVFRLGGVGTASEKRNKTVARLQRLENALSGYYAAFGSYPPVQLEGRSRNIHYQVNGYGIQQTSRDPQANSFNWSQIEAACRAQPVAMEFPYSAAHQDYVSVVARELKRRHDAGGANYKAFADNEALGYGFDGLKQPSQLSGKKDEAEWTETQIFKFGLMSYLLPRYLIMMGHDSTTLYDEFAQWSDNNDIPARFEDGVAYDDWDELNQDLKNGTEAWKIALLPSQAITARWLVNFQNALACNTSQSFYGVNLKSDDATDSAGLSVANPYPKLYSSGDSQSGTGTSGSQQYALNEITIRDGWGNEFYYYSLPPYQNYRVWSAGPNGKTFPPWISPEEDVYRDNASTIQSWVADDIVHMKN